MLLTKGQNLKGAMQLTIEVSVNDFHTIQLKS